MQTFSKPHTIKSKRLLLYFILGWVLLNFLQAACIGVDADEAYYWLYAQHLDWGYFDHPPLVALSIKLGETFGHGPFYTRLGTVLLSAGTVYFGFKAMPPHLANLRLYLLLFSSLALFHVYSFIATPDAALLFFTTLFFYAYRKYLDKESAAHILLLACSIAGLLYSKYHGVLPVLFTFLSHPKLVLKPSAWIVVILALLLFSPHLWWQYQYDWPTFRYHLYERIGSRYKLSKTLNYIAAQLFIWGPFTTIPALYLFVKRKQPYTVYERAHLFTFWGVLLFFLFSSFRSTIEAHWTLAAGPSFIVLFAGVFAAASETWKSWLLRLSVLTVFLLLIARSLFIIQPAPLKKVKAFRAFMYAQPWANEMHAFADGKPIVFVDSYKFPALYQYYQPAAKTWSYATVQSRKNQFNIYKSDTALQNKTVYLASTNPWNGRTHFFKTPYDDFYLQPLDSFQIVNGLKIKWMQPLSILSKASSQLVAISLVNAGNDTISAQHLSVTYTFLKTRNEQITPETTQPLSAKTIPPGFQKESQLTIKAPEEKGTYQLVFSIVQGPLAGTFASPFYKVVVE